ncbi:MAG: hypothetical protein HRF50_12365 [Phycisphaerae bacterium]
MPPSLLLVCAAIATTLRAAPPLNPLSPPNFSLDLGSPTLGGGRTAADILAAGGGGPTVVVDGGDLGLTDPLDDLDAAGVDTPHPGAGKFALVFSVSRSTIGAVSPDPALVAAGVPYNVADQAARRQAPGDLYITTTVFDLVSGPAPRGASGNNTLVTNQFDEGGTSFGVDPADSAESYNAAPEEEADDVDACSDGATTRSGDAIYFSLTSGSPTLSQAGFPGSANPSGAHLFYNAKPGQSSTVLYAGRAQLGLSSAADDIDAFVVFDAGKIGAFDSGDIVLFSLAPGSPSLGTIPGASSPGGAADIFIKRHGSSLAVFASASMLGLGALPDKDDVDSLCLLPCEDPTECATQHGIRRVTGDCDNDGDLDPTDFACLLDCWSGPDVQLDTDGTATHDVSVGGGGFTPADVIIEVGDTVRWTWAGGLHNVVSGRFGFPDGNFSSGAPTSITGTMYSVTFTRHFLNNHPMPANVYPYYCGVHGHAGAVFVASDPCSRFDFDGDRDVDMADAAAFQAAAP